MKIVIVGMGFMGKMHASVYSMLPGMNLVAFVDTAPDHHKDYLRQNPKPVYPTLEEALESEQVDVVDICLPTFLHCDFARRAIRRGKHVFCEKPIALAVHDAQETVRLAQQSGVAFMIGHCLRFWPEYQYLEELIKSERLGRLLSLTMERLASRPIWSIDNWLQNEKKSMGCAVDMHIHDTDFALHLFGMPQAVSSVGTRDYAGFSWIQTLYHYPHVQVSAIGGWNLPQRWGFKMGFRAVFEKGVMEYDSLQSPTVLVAREGGMPRKIKVKNPQVCVKTQAGGNISAPGGYYNELKYFCDCLKRGKLPRIATGSDATASLQVCLSEIKSAETHRPVSLK